MPEAAPNRPIQAGPPQPPTESPPPLPTPPASPAEPSAQAPPDLPSPPKPAKGKGSGRGGARRGAGRPKKADSEGQGNPKIATLKGDDGWAAIDRVAEKKWANCASYLYRLWPIVDHMQSSRPFKYIDKFLGEKPSRDYIIQMHGSGVYRLSMTDQLSKTDRKEFIRADFTIQETNNPPVLNKEEIVFGHPQNQGYEEFLRARDEHPEQKAMREDMMNPGPNPADSVAVKEMANLTRMIQGNKGSDSNTALITALIGVLGKQSDPNNTVQMLKTMREMTAPAAPAQQDGMSATLPLIVQMMQNSQTQMIEMFKIMAEQKNPAGAAPPDPMKQLTQFTQIAETMKGLIAQPEAAVAEAIDPKWKLLETAVEQFGPAAMVMAQRFAMPTAPAAPAAINPSASAPPTAPGQTPPPYPHAMTQPAAGAPAATNPAAAPGAPEVPEVIPEFMKAKAIELSEQVYRQMMQGATGSDYAYTFIDIQGEANYQSVVAAGPEFILKVFSKIPEIEQKFAPVWPTLEEFVSEFCNPQDPDEEEPPPPPPAAKAMPAKPRAATPPVDDKAPARTRKASTTKTKPKGAK